MLVKCTRNSVDGVRIEDTRPTVVAIALVYDLLLNSILL